MKRISVQSIVIFIGLSSMISCNSGKLETTKTQQTMFTVEQIKEKMMQVRTGADFPVLAMNLKNLGVTYYETKMIDGSSIFHGENGYEVLAGPNYEPIVIADNVNIEKLKADIGSHQQGESDYFEISRQCAENGIEKWAVCLGAMTCTYVDKKGNKVLVEQIPDASGKVPIFTIEQLKVAHSKVKSGADFPSYIKEIKALGVTHYETFVSDGHINYYGANNYVAKVPAKYDVMAIAVNTNMEVFTAELLAHQQGKTDFLTFIKMCAEAGIEKWEISMSEMTCTYFDKVGKQVLVEKIPE